jgi:hypothetical protein
MNLDDCVRWEGWSKIIHVSSTEGSLLVIMTIRLGADGHHGILEKGLG